MKIAVLGSDGPLARATRAALEFRGHTVVNESTDCAVFFPGSPEELEQVAASGRFQRLVLRSRAYVYGSNTKNPGMMNEERVSLLPPDVPEYEWVKLEEIASRHPNAAIVRLTNVLSRDEGDLVVRQISQPAACVLAGHDPNVQFISVQDGAQALSAAAEARSTGVFNAAGAGTVPLKKAFLAAGTRRIPLPRPLVRKTLLGKSADQLQYNWTVSSERAHRELGWRASRSSAQALADFVAERPGANPTLLAREFDDWGLDLPYIRARGAWFWFLRNVYWRIDHEGMENIPAAGRALLVSNHRGFMPLDAVMHLSLILTHARRITRFLIISNLLRFPFLCNFLTKLGGVIANQENAAQLFAAENLVGIFPEGIRGTFLPYKRAYKLRDFTRSGFARMAIEHQAPIIPAAVVGHAEIFPIIGRVDSSYITREFGWPYLPIAPMFPLAPVPLPSKWHVRVLPPVPFQGLKPADAENLHLVSEFARHVQHTLQSNIDDMLSRRRHIFWGSILNGTGPAVNHRSSARREASNES
jgi:1-acyl-sn-glycerol-3-phosphate acyltransferase